MTERSHHGGDTHADLNTEGDENLV
jgi:hypothetical protein